MVPLSSRFRMLAVKCRCQHPAGPSSSPVRVRPRRKLTRTPRHRLPHSLSSSSTLEQCRSSLTRSSPSRARSSSTHSGSSTRRCSSVASCLSGTFPRLLSLTWLFYVTMQMAGQEPRQTTGNIGHLNKPSIQALIHGLNRHYYSSSPVSILRSPSA